MTWPTTLGFFSFCPIVTGKVATRRSAYCGLPIGECVLHYQPRPDKGLAAFAAALSLA
jgi:hypothetical protein